ncbi:hypothetical protein COOONC_05810 [Cooperia oncophora]
MAVNRYAEFETANKSNVVPEPMQPETLFRFHMKGVHIHGFFRAVRQVIGPSGKTDMFTLYLQDIFYGRLFPLYRISHQAHRNHGQQQISSGEEQQEPEDQMQQNCAVPATITGSNEPYTFFAPPPLQPRPSTQYQFPEEPTVVLPLSAIPFYAIYDQPTEIQTPSENSFTACFPYQPPQREQHYYTEQQQQQAAQSIPTSVASDPGPMQPNPLMESQNPNRRFEQRTGAHSQAPPHSHNQPEAMNRAGMYHSPRTGRHSHNSGNAVSCS